MLISDTAGMDKSTLLTHTSKQIEPKSPAKWVMKFDSNDHTGTINVLQGEQMSEKKAAEFVLEE